MIHNENEIKKERTVELDRQIDKKTDRYSWV